MTITPKQAVDRIEAAGHGRPQDRRLHARGAVYAARFVPSGHVSSFTTAAHLVDGCDVVVRFSNGSPQFDSDDRAKGIRGMAVKFLADGKAVHDLVAANFTVFPSRNPEGFIDLVEAFAGLNDKQPSALGKALRLVVEHPESRPGLKNLATRKPPLSFATCRFDGLHAFYLVDSAGVRRAFRYRLVPQLGEVDLTSSDGVAKDFLIPELDARLKDGPVLFTLAFQFAEDGDPTHDPSKAWPETRKLLPAGQIVVSERSVDEEAWQRSVFDPTRLAAGVEVSDDQVLAFRPQAYTISSDRRLSH